MNSLLIKIFTFNTHLQELGKKELATTKVVPISLGEALDALEKDPYASKMPDIFTVQTIVDFVLGKQAAAQPG